MKDKIAKFLNVIKRDGIITTLKKTYKYVVANYLARISLKKRIYFKKNRDRLIAEIDGILGGKYDRILVWRGSFGWNVPLFQRPQQIANCLKEKNCLIFYEVTRMTDNVDFIKKECENLYLINYESSAFEKLLFDKLISCKAKKYIQIYSTCWDVSKEKVDLYLQNGFDMLYEYIDDLNPKIAGTDKLPKNITDIHDYVATHKNVSVVTSADRLFEDMTKKRGSAENIILSTNGVDLPHFSASSSEKVPEMEEIKNGFEKIVGYYGALAMWFDYETVKKLALKFPEIAFVLIGVKYDTSFDASGLNEIKNVKYLGPIDYRALPSYARYFDICFIPFVINEITLSTNPIKVFEYMALGKYIITSDMPECRKYKSVNIAKSFDDYCTLIEKHDLAMTDEYKTTLRIEAEQNSWEHKADEIIELLKNNEKQS